MTRSIPAPGFLAIAATKRLLTNKSNVMVSATTGTLQSADLMMGKTAPESAFHLGLTVKFALFREPTRSQSVNRDRFFRRSLLVIGR
ncbi:hypothetical protein KQX54_008163 [Cotesia glomerata]|uniref:Uncharacterized protein n=1 Tax=Cotesia glomerata TaxID=32391 RepID=A0AAV7IJH5_COTGL|nr:hypothetical protein KQX54_008163 [Cotesia glomerata]